MYFKRNNFVLGRTMGCWLSKDSKTVDVAETESASFAGGTNNMFKGFAMWAGGV